MKLRINVRDLYSLCNGNLAGAEFYAEVEVLDSDGTSAGTGEVKLTGKVGPNSTYVREVELSSLVAR